MTWLAWRGQNHAAPAGVARATIPTWIAPDRADCFLLTNLPAPRHRPPAMETFWTYLVIGAGSALGGMGRYGLARLVAQRCGARVAAHRPRLGLAASPR